jgi:dCMP deaminase
MNDRWKVRYLKLAHEVSKWSKDPSLQIGAVAVGDKGQLLSQGYNGFPRGIADNVDRLMDRETKYKYVVHAEMNVIYNASYNGTSLDGSTLFVWGLPVCSECAKGIIQVGIKNVVMPAQDIPERWADSWAFTQHLFAEGGVKWEFVSV